MGNLLINLFEKDMNIAPGDIALYERTSTFCSFIDLFQLLKLTWELLICEEWIKTIKLVTETYRDYQTNAPMSLLFFFPESPAASFLDEIGGLSWLLDRIYFHAQNDRRSFNNEGFSESPSRGDVTFGLIKVIAP
ncbi:hypothetical protein CEXT_30821 [Caerostris extrusa]|uniref:Uncharacterized protein n=1 Tax=Caerostris extrusa TaxID=172846 RepID=A0AAV4WPI2_CAEEX|nr:hypothetical protein CEXT_30821 [Caerostris extrusa]